MKWILFVVGLGLLPLCVALSETVFELVKGLHDGTVLLPPPALALVGGFMGWLLVYYTLPHPIRSYVLAHELTHAPWAALMGARVSGLKVGKNGGSVTLSKNNLWITLAPYFFPLYTMLVIAIYGLLSVFVAVERYVVIWLGLVGFSWGFHFTFTVTTLLQHQTDIQEYGRLFSYVAIYALNMAGIGLWIVMVSSATLEEMIALTADHSLHVLRRVWEAAAPLRGALNV